jgi:hypothetical protein
MAAHAVSDERHPGTGHRDGVKAHVVIQLADGVDVFAAYRAIKEKRLGGKPGKHVKLIELHIGLGEYDMIADLHCTWTHPEGDETRYIGEWINAARLLKDRGGRFHIKRTSTLVCMNT